jgi:predicted secreted protein
MSEILSYALKMPEVADSILATKINKLIFYLNEVLKVKSYDITVNHDEKTIEIKVLNLDSSVRFKLKQEKMQELQGFVQTDYSIIFI